MEELSVFILYVNAFSYHLKDNMEIVLNFNKLKKIGKEPLSVNEKLLLLPDSNSKEHDITQRALMLMYAKETKAALNIFPLDIIFQNIQIFKEIFNEEIFTDTVLKYLALNPEKLILYYINRKNLRDSLSEQIIKEFDLLMERFLEVLLPLLIENNLLIDFISELALKDRYYYEMYLNILEVKDFKKVVQDKFIKHAIDGNINVLRLQNILSNKEIQKIFYKLYKEEDFLNFLFKISNENFSLFNKLNYETRYFIKRLFLQKLSEQSYDVLKETIFKHSFYVQRIKPLKIQEEYNKIIYNFEDDLAENLKFSELEISLYDKKELYLRHYNFSEIYEMIRLQDKYHLAMPLSEILLYEIAFSLSLDQVLTLPKFFNRKILIDLSYSKLIDLQEKRNLILFQEIIKGYKKEFVGKIIELYGKNNKNINIYENLAYLLEVKELKEIYSIQFIFKNSSADIFKKIFLDLNVIEKFEFWKGIKKELNSANSRAYQFINSFDYFDNYSDEIKKFSPFIKKMASKKEYFKEHFNEYISNENNMPWDFPFLFSLKYSKDSFDKIFQKTYTLDYYGFFIKTLIENNPAYINKYYQLLFKKPKVVELMISNFNLIPKSKHKEIIEDLINNNKTTVDKLFRIKNLEKYITKKDFGIIVENINKRPYQAYGNITEVFRYQEDLEKFFINKIKFIGDEKVIRFLITSDTLESSYKEEVIALSKIKNKTLSLNISDINLINNELKIKILHKFKLNKDVYYQMINSLKREEWHDKWIYDEKSLEIYIQNFGFDNFSYDLLIKKPSLINLTKNYYYQFLEDEEEYFWKLIVKNLKKKTYNEKQYHFIFHKIMNITPHRVNDLLKIFNEFEDSLEVFKFIFKNHRRIKNDFLINYYRKSKVKSKKQYLENRVYVDWKDIKDKTLFESLLRGNLFTAQLQKFLSTEYWLSSDSNSAELIDNFNKLSSFDKKNFLKTFLHNIDKYLIGKKNIIDFWNSISNEERLEVLMDDNFYKLIYPMGKSFFRKWQESLIKEGLVTNNLTKFNVWEILDEDICRNLDQSNSDELNRIIKIMNKKKHNFKKESERNKNKIYLYFLIKNKINNKQFYKLNDFWRDQLIDYSFEENLVENFKGGEIAIKGTNSIVGKRIFSIFLKNKSNSQINNGDYFAHINVFNYRKFVLNTKTQEYELYGYFQLKRVADSKNIVNVFVDMKDAFKIDIFESHQKYYLTDALNNLSTKYDEIIDSFVLENIHRKGIFIKLKEDSQKLMEMLTELFIVVESFNSLIQDIYYEKQISTYRTMETALKKNYVNYFSGGKNLLQELNFYQDAQYYANLIKLDFKLSQKNKNNTDKKSNKIFFLNWLNEDFQKKKALYHQIFRYDDLSIFQVNYKDIQRNLRNYPMLDDNNLMILLSNFHLSEEDIQEIIADPDNVLKLHSLYYIK